MARQGVEMKNLRAILLPLGTAAVIGLMALVTFLVLWLPSERAGHLVYQWQLTEDHIQEVARCLENHRALEQIYPAGLEKVEVCLKQNHSNLVNPWEEPVEYVASKGGEAYVLRSCIPGSRCWRFASEHFDPYPMEDGLEIRSGEWIQPSRLDASDLSLQATLNSGEKSALKVEVTSTVEVETAWTKSIRKNAGYGFSVTAESDFGKWELDDTGWKAGEGPKEIWRASRSSGWDGNKASSSFQVACSGDEARLLLSVRLWGELERSLANNFYLLKCEVP